MTKQLAIVWLLRATGVVMVANGLWMLAHAFHWFFNIPAGLPDTGDPNGHLIRDVGLAYIVFGAALVWSTFKLAERRAVYLCVTAFMLGHASVHVIEIMLGALPPSHWLIDLPLVLLPGALFAAFIHPSAWRWLTQTG
jgi:hypothetical protein